MTSNSTRRRPEHPYNTNFAALLTLVSLATLLIISLSSNNRKNVSKLKLNNRKLDDSYSSCGDIWINTDPPSVDEQKSKSARCIYAQNCNDGKGVYFQAVFCSDTFSAPMLLTLTTPVLVLLLITLFRVLGTTAEEYFSPALELFATKLGLPPRFAGVSLLALGNGAADVSATISAVTMDAISGYKMSLGALTGAGMFIGTVVAGAVILVAGDMPGGAVKCRGALIRDIVMYLLSISLVYTSFHFKKAIDSVTITSFFTLYGVFVIVVLCADMYHRRVVLPRARALQERLERQRDAANPTCSNSNTSSSDESANSMTELVAIEATKVPVHVRDGGNVVHAGHMTHLSGEGGSTLDEWHDPTNNSNSNQVFDHTKNGGVWESMLVALSNYDKETPYELEEADLEREENQLYHLHGSHGLIADPHRHRLEQQSINSSDINNTTPDVEGEYTSPYRVLELDLGDPCAASMHHTSAYNWKSGFIEAKEDLINHVKECWDDMFHNDENRIWDKILLAIELPFLILRKITVPVPSDGYYCRPLVALSLALSPLWFALYLIYEHDINLFMSGGGMLPYAEILMTVSFFLGCLVIRYGPEGNGPMALGVAGPIALWGFVVAATWIDFVADQLVDLLGYFGLVLRIPGSILGLTVLAWGNSMSDLSANVAMTKKGLANMAITACYAGPIFNMLIGLGAGFTALNTQTGQLMKEVETTPTIDVGFLFLTCNCICVLVTGTLVTKGFLTKKFGLVALCLYSMYIISAVSLHLSGYE